MISRNERCVYVASYLHEAALVISLLGEAGIEAEIMNEATSGGIEGLVGLVPRAGLKGMEIWVGDPARAEAARGIIARRMEEVNALRATRENRTGNVIFECTSCHKQISFPATEQGTVQNCPECFEYVDVPDPNESEDWALDTGEPETDDEHEGDA